MVATSGTIAGRRWQLAPSLVALFMQADERWPRRLKASDGSVGDALHLSRSSDHNVSASGFVTAADLTHDPANGPDAHAWADHLRATRDPRVKYVISNGRIFASYDSYTRRAWQWGKYSGTNPHSKHVHVSVLDTPEARNDTRPWFPPVDGNSNQGDEDLTPEQDRMLRDIHAVLTNPADPKSLLPVVTAARDNTNRLRRMVRLVAAKVGVGSQELADAEK